MTLKKNYGHVGAPHLLPLQVSSTDEAAIRPFRFLTSSLASSYHILKSSSNLPFPLLRLGVEGKIARIWKAMWEKVLRLEREK